jgi:hypothetical protein
VIVASVEVTTAVTTFVWKTMIFVVDVGNIVIVLPPGLITE